MTTAEPPTQPDSSEPSVARQAELEAAYAAQQETEVPYHKVEIRTLGELQWIFAQRKWSGSAFLPPRMRRPNLRGALLFETDLRGVELVHTNLQGATFIAANVSDASIVDSDLSGADFVQTDLSHADLGGSNCSNGSFIESTLHHTTLSFANLSGADLSRANLEDAILKHANLAKASGRAATWSRANLSQANLSQADFSGADLSGANLTQANLSQADFSGANLSDATLKGALMSNGTFSGTNLRHTILNEANVSGADVSMADLSGADLTRVLFNAESVLDGIIFDARTKVLAVRWNGAPLDGIDWRRLPRLGDEPEPKQLVGKSAQERAAIYRAAVRAYHGLAVALRDQGLADVASAYRLRELAMERAALRAERHIGGWLLNILLGGIAGHGEKPGRAFVAYLGIIASFTAIYWAASVFLGHDQQPLQWYEALVLSFSSFHGRGFFPSTISLGDPLALIAVAEAVIGLFIELIFIATFSRRFLSD